MRRTLRLFLSIAAAAHAGAASLRGHGVEEVGKPIEHFSPEDDYYHVDRSILVDKEGRAALGGAFRERPGEDVVDEEVGEPIERFSPGVDYYHVDRSVLVDMEGRATLGGAFDERPKEKVDEWPEDKIVGNVVEDEDETYVEEYRGDVEEPMGEAAALWPEVDNVGDVEVRAGRTRVAR